MAPTNSSLKVFGDGRLHMRRNGRVLRLAPPAAVEQDNANAVAGGIAHGHDMVRVAVGNQPEGPKRTADRWLPNAPARMMRSTVACRRFMSNLAPA